MRFFLLSLSFLFCLKAIAQTNETEAKAAYLLAEESYSKGDQKSALRYIESAKKSLGGANSKLIYLQIQIEQELVKNKKISTDSLLALINRFENLPDYKSFNEDKVLEVAKIKLALKNELEDAKEKVVAEKGAVENTFVLFEKKYGEWKVGSTLEDLKRERPAFAAAFARKSFKKDSCHVGADGVTRIDFGGYYLNFEKTGELRSAFCTRLLFRFFGLEAQAQGKAPVKAAVESALKDLGYLPKPNIIENNDSYSETYTMESGKKKIVLKISIGRLISEAAINYSSFLFAQQ